MFYFNSEIDYTIGFEMNNMTKNIYVTWLFLSQDGQWWNEEGKNVI